MESEKERSVGEGAGKEDGWKGEERRNGERKGQRVEHYFTFQNKINTDHENTRDLKDAGPSLAIKYIC